MNSKKRREIRRLLEKVKGKRTTLEYIHECIQRIVSESSEVPPPTIKDVEESILSQLSLEAKRNISSPTLESLSESGIIFREHQIEVSEVFSRQRSMIVCHDVGTGKTLSSILAFQTVLSTERESGRRRYVIVVSPKALEQNMKKEMRKVGLDPDVYVENTTFRQYTFLNYEIFANIYFGVEYVKKVNEKGKEYYAREITNLTTRENVEARIENAKILFRQAGFPPLEDCILVFDEMHKARTDYMGYFSEFSTASSSNSFSVVNSNNAFFSLAATVIETASIAFKVMGITATPMFNSVEDINNLLTLVLPGSNGEPRNTPLPSSDFNRIMEGKLTPSLIDFFKSNFFFKIPSKKEYPDRLERNVFLKMEPEYEEIYLEYQNSVVKNAGGDFGQLSSNKFLNKMRSCSNTIGNIAFNQRVENPKSEYIRNVFLNLGGEFSARVEGGYVNKVAIYSNFIGKGVQVLMENVIKSAGEKFLSVIGGQSRKSISRDVDLYNSDVENPDLNSRTQIPRFFFLSPAGGAGITLKGVRHFIIFDPAWNRGVDDQAEGRGSRYMSHSHLPSEYQNITIHRLIQTKSHEFKVIRENPVLQTGAMTRVPRGVFIPTLPSSEYLQQADESAGGSSAGLINEFERLETLKGDKKMGVELHLFFMGLKKELRINRALKRIGKPLEE